jgi:hypothetical protein
MVNYEQKHKQSRKKKKKNNKDVDAHGTTAASSIEG